MPARLKSAVTLEHTIASIARRSEGVRWLEDSEGLALVRTPRGYALTAARGETQGDMLPERVFVARDNGTTMGDGHRLTKGERERAVRTILAD
jgi:hypothetical protein